MGIRKTRVVESALLGPIHVTSSGRRAAVQPGLDHDEAPCRGGGPPALLRRTRLFESAVLGPVRVTISGRHAGT
jgi:hypothetical protein